jgi:hypothetical protein
LTGYWPFNSVDSSTASDLSGTKNDGSISAGVSVTEKGVFGTKAFEINGGEVVVSSPKDLPTGDSSFATVLWFKDLGTNDNDGIIHWGSNNPDSGSGQEVRDGGWQHYFFSNDLNCYNIGLQDGQWHMLTVSFDSETDSRKMFLDGNLRCRDNPGSVSITKSEIRIGNGDSSDQMFNGVIDEVRLYDRALDGADIRDLYEASKEGYLLSNQKNSGARIEPESLQLNASAELNGGSVTVGVKSDPDNDSIFEEKADVELIEGKRKYNSISLNSKSSIYRLNVSLDSSGPESSPEVSNISIIGSSTSSICDFRGRSNECVSNSTHKIGGQSLSIDSVLETRQEASFEAVGEKADIAVSNTSIISGFWKGSFNISVGEDRNQVIKAGAELRPAGGSIVLN